MSRTIAHTPWRVSHPDYERVLIPEIGEEMPLVDLYGRDGVYRHMARNCGCRMCGAVQAEHRAEVRRKRYQTKAELRRWIGED